MTRILQTRVEPKHIEKLDAIKRQTGLTTSQIFRALIDRAEVKPLEVRVDLSNKTENDVTGQGKNVVFAS